MSAIFILKIEPPKKKKHFIFLKVHHFVMDGPIYMKVGMFWETSVDFIKSVVLSKNITKVMSIWMSKVGQNTTTCKK